MAQQAILPGGVVRQAAQPAQLLLAEHILSAVHHLHVHGHTEDRTVHQRRLVISLHRSQQMRLHQRQALGRVAIEADIIAQPQNTLRAMGLHIVQHSLQGFQVGVDIG